MVEVNRRALLIGAPLAVFGGHAWATPAPAPRDIGHIQVLKEKRVLELISRNRKILKTYAIQLGGQPIGHKRFMGDKRTPEGIYRIDRRNRQSFFYRSLGISYPNAEDRRFAARHGKSPGGEIFIHGQHPKSEQTVLWDWTRGCIALDNHDMRELFGLISIGTKIAIYP